MPQGAYDLDAFANRPKSNYSGIRVAQGGKPNRKRLERLRSLNTAIMAALLLGLACSLLQSYATLKELNMSVQYTQNELATAKSEYDYLSSVLSSKTNLKTVEEVAGAELGLMKRDESQVTYITMEKESVISSPETGTEKLVNYLHCLGSDILQALDP